MGTHQGLKPTMSGLRCHAKKTTTIAWVVAAVAASPGGGAKLRIILGDVVAGAINTMGGHAILVLPVQFILAIFTQNMYIAQGCVKMSSPPVTAGVIAALVVTPLTQIVDVAVSQSASGQMG